jgi:hypothetical protein
MAAAQRVHGTLLLLPRGEHVLGEQGALLQGAVPGELDPAAIYGRRRQAGREDQDNQHHLPRSSGAIPGALNLS